MKGRRKEASYPCGGGGGESPVFVVVVVVVVARSSLSDRLPHAGAAVVGFVIHITKKAPPTSTKEIAGATYTIYDLINI